jgi:TIR domain
MTSEISKPKAHFLRLVETPYRPEPISKETFVRPGWQSTFFATANPCLLLFVNFQKISENDFVTALEGARPKILIDLRRVPRFDLGSLNRRRVFSIFASVGIQYIDLSGRLKSTGQFPEQLAPSKIADLVLELLGGGIEGPLAFVVEAQQFDEPYITELIEVFPSKQDHPWDILRLPFSNDAAALQQLVRNLVFISHANPEDNAFATWLAGQLALAGYSVWSDVIKLVGGETFWDDIEQTIRHRAAKVIAVLSRHSHNKPGVLDEIDLAVRVERANGLERFVLPIRLDDMPYADIRANIARKIVIDFSDNWAAGLHKLLNALERDRVARSPSSNADALAGWVRGRIAQQTSLALEPQELITNWLPIRQLPSTISMLDISASSEHIDSLMRAFRLPCFRYLRLIGSFASSDDFNAIYPLKL